MQTEFPPPEKFPLAKKSASALKEKPPAAASKTSSPTNDDDGGDAGGDEKRATLSEQAPSIVSTDAPPSVTDRCEVVALQKASVVTDPPKASPPETFLGKFSAVPINSAPPPPAQKKQQSTGVPESSQRKRKPDIVQRFISFCGCFHNTSNTNALVKKGKKKEKNRHNKNKQETDDEKREEEERINTCTDERLKAKMLKAREKRENDTILQNVADMYEIKAQKHTQKSNRWAFRVGLFIAVLIALITLMPLFMNTEEECPSNSPCLFNNVTNECQRDKEARKARARAAQLTFGVCLLLLLVLLALFREYQDGRIHDYKAASVLAKAQIRDPFVFNIIFSPGASSASSIASTHGFVHPRAAATLTHATRHEE